MLRGQTELPEWLADLVAGQIAMSGLPATDVAPAVWPETGGRGFLLSEQGKRPMGNAETVRFMAPRVFAGDQDRYLRYTDVAGDYVEPATGSARGRSPQARDEPPEWADTHGSKPAHKRPRAQPWIWPASEIRPVGVGSIEMTLLGRRIAAVQRDESGARLVLEQGSGSEPTVYVHFVRPDLRVSSTGEQAFEVDPDRVVGAEAVGQLMPGGGLAISLSTGLTLSCDPEARFEAWQLVAQDEGMWICLPGGETGEFLFR